jgi:hypothetical protein
MGRRFNKGSKRPLLPKANAMSADTASQDDAEVFTILLTGQVVRCVSLEDAVAVKTAEDILCGNDSTPYLPAMLNRIADVLVRYNRLDVAERLVGRRFSPLSRKSP